MIFLILHCEQYKGFMDSWINFSHHTIVMIDFSDIFLLILLTTKPFFTTRTLTPPHFPELVFKVGIGSKTESVEFFPTWMSFLGYWAASIRSHCDDDVWWRCWLRCRPILWFLPNTRHYSVFIHSCLQAVQPQSSAVRHWAALWSYWDSRLLSASNKMLFETSTQSDWLRAVLYCR